ncbi:MAG: DUF4384 domain-containing protein [Syntrophobacteraceae bacterium]
MADLNSGMKYSRLIVSVLILFVFGVRSASGVQNPPPSITEDERVSFRWAFGALIGGSDGPKLEPVRDNAVLKAGDKLKMMVEMRKKCFVYVIYYNAQGEVSMLFPYSLEQLTKDYEPSRRYFVPKKDAWFELDEKSGTETFYLIASSHRLSEVEYLMNRYESAESGKKHEIAGQMALKIRNLEMLHNEYASQRKNPDTELNVTRGVERAQGLDPNDISSLSEEITSNGVYVRTITIDHR